MYEINYQLKIKLGGVITVLLTTVLRTDLKTRLKNGQTKIQLQDSSDYLRKIIFGMIKMKLNMQMKLKNK